MKVALIALLLASVVGCGGQDTRQTNPEAPVPSTALNITTSCSSPEPPHESPFKFNRDWKRRDRLLGVVPDRYVGGTANLSFDINTLAALFDLKYIDPYDRQNEAPTAWDIYQFMCTHSGVMAEGYVVAADRDDYRVSLETIFAPRIDDRLRSDATRFCSTADEVTFVGHLECFWD